MPYLPLLPLLPQRASVFSAPTANFAIFCCFFAIYDAMRWASGQDLLEWTSAVSTRRELHLAGAETRLRPRTPPAAAAGFLDFWSR